MVAFPKLRSLVMNSLKAFGWKPFFQHQLSISEYDSKQIARVTFAAKDLYRLRFDKDRELLGTISGKFRHEAHLFVDLPVVGDWVVCEARFGEGQATIHRVLERQTQLTRNTAGNKDEEQILASNVDIAFIVTSLNQDLNLRRLERYLTMIWDSGAEPIILLTKADLCENISQVVFDVETVACGAPIHVISVYEERGIEAVQNYFLQGSTAVLLGSSGVGKSTLVNRLMEQADQAIQTIRDADGKGRHTTTARQLLSLPQGGMIIDTPGMRELQLWEAEGSLDRSFADIAEWSTQCKFRDCQHHNEPGCAVQKAIERNELTLQRLTNYRKLQRELALELTRHDKVEAARYAQAQKKQMLEHRRILKTRHKLKFR